MTPDWKRPLIGAVILEAIVIALFIWKMLSR